MSRLSWEEGLKLLKVDREQKLTERPPLRVYIRNKKVIARIPRKQEK